MNNKATHRTCASIILKFVHTGLFTPCKEWHCNVWINILLQQSLVNGTTIKYYSLKKKSNGSQKNSGLMLNYLQIKYEIKC